MSVFMGCLAVVLLLAMMYIAAAWVTNWAWKQSARYMTIILLVSCVFIGLLLLAVVSFTGGFA